MSNTVLIKRSGTSSVTPTTLESGEIAINYADGKLFYKNSSNAIVGAKLITGINGTANQISVSESSGTFTLSLPSSVYVSSLFVDNIEIDTTGATPNYVLAFDGTKFKPTQSGGSLANLADVSISAPQIGEVIKYNGSNWVNNLETGYNNSYAAIIGDGTNNTFVLTHNFGTRDIFVQCRNNASPYENINVRWEATTDNTVTLDFSTTPATDSVRVNVYASVGAVGPSAFSQTIGDGTNTDYVITHNLQTRDVLFVARNVSSPYEVIEVNWQATTTNSVTAIFATPPSSNSVRATVYAAGGASGVTHLSGTTNEIEVSGSTGNIQIGLPNNVTISGNLTVSGDITINGNTTTVNTETLSVEDNIIVLNSNVSGSPTTDAGIEIERGTSPNVLIRWNETSDKWELTSNGTNYYNILNTSSNIDDIGNVALSDPVNGEFLKFNGTNWVNSAITSFDDPVITLGGDTAPSSDDNKDRGIEFRWHNGSTAKTGFFGYDDSTGKLTFIPDATNTSEVFSGTLGTIDVGAIHINGSQISASDLSNGTTGTGSVVLASGAALSGVPTAPTAAADTNTTQIATTAFVITQAGATTPSYISSGQYATIGSSLRYAREDHTHGYNGLGLTSGTLAQFASTTSSQLASIISDETGSGALVFGTSPAITTSITTPSSTFSLVNTTATTVNFAGAGTTISIGAATGTTTVNNNLVVSGNLTVSGTTTTINTTELTINDNVIILNNGSSATPSFNAGIEVERGDFTNVQIRWNESTDKWQFTNDGVTYKDLGSGGVTVSDAIPSAPAEGDMWYESDTGALFAYYDSQWIEIGGSAAYNEIIGTIQAKGDLLAGSASQSLTRLGVGSNGTRLAADSTTTTGLAWISDAQNSVIDAKGDLLVGLSDNTVGKLSVGTNGQILVADSSQTSGIGWTNLNTRNLLYNGAMQVHQRGISSTGITGTVTNYYTADRWRTSNVNLGTWTQTIENDAPTGSGFRKSLKMLCTTADAVPDPGDQMDITQPLEGLDLQIIKKGTSNAEKLTVSFWVKSNVTGTYIVELFDVDNTRHVCAPYNISASATWEYKIITFPADTIGALDNDNNNSLSINFKLGLGSSFTSGTLATSWAAYTAANRGAGQVNLASAINNYWQITGVQLNVGPVVAPFEFKSFERELRECQRYYWRTGGTPFGPIGIANTHSTTNGRVYIKLPVTMRRDPTGINMIGSAAATGSGTFTSLGHDRATTDALMANLVGTGFTAGGATMIYGSGDGTTFMEVTGAEL